MSARALALLSIASILVEEAFAWGLAHREPGPPLHAALSMVAFVLVRVFAVVIAPGLLACAAVVLAARYWVRSSSGAGISDEAGAGTSIGARGVE